MEQTVWDLQEQVVDLKDQIRTEQEQTRCAVSAFYSQTPLDL